LRYVRQQVDANRVSVLGPATAIAPNGVGILYSSCRGRNAGVLEYEGVYRDAKSDRTYKRTYELHFRVGPDGNEASCESPGDSSPHCTAGVNPKSCNGKPGACSVVIDYTFK